MVVSESKKIIPDPDPTSQKCSGSGGPETQYTDL